MNLGMNSDALGVPAILSLGFLVLHSAVFKLFFASRFLLLTATKRRVPRLHAEPALHQSG